MIKLNKKDMEILNLLQKDSKQSIKEIARKVNSPITTVFDKIKRMEKLGIIKYYKAILDSAKLDKGTTAFILVSFVYRLNGSEEPLSQMDVVKDIARFPQVQELYIVSGDWDILMKIKEKDVDSVGNFITNNLRKIKGVEKTLTFFNFHAIKETTEIHI